MHDKQKRPYRQFTPATWVFWLDMVFVFLFPLVVLSAHLFLQSYLQKFLLLLGYVIIMGTLPLFEKQEQLPTTLTLISKYFFVYWCFGVVLAVVFYHLVFDTVIMG